MSINKNIPNLEVINHMVGSVSVHFADFAESKNVTAINNNQALPMLSFFEFSAFYLHKVSRLSLSSQGENFQDYVYNSTREKFIETYSKFWCEDVEFSKIWKDDKRLNNKYSKTVMGLNKFLDHREIEFSKFDNYFELHLEGLINTLSPVIVFTGDETDEKFLVISDNFVNLLESFDLLNTINLINLKERKGLLSSLAAKIF